ncbi:substrate-binding periplasmic protein [Insolitispirillum peregrinum]|uniref:Amino acid ABC transporter substrate-binding protein, PAAT family n=1 Tax=Insolitispirillum peregrinum TaxID=80876 RepID=A0A1N7MM67_9PROT|nr:transporter substrate-binding domain-containing protein [Insolitispirillum peregrinum]SIS87110.1 amino acid ABC transporter substrate-binding protein, PAAT family [Insolitispirillum peregrinum]
MWIKRVLTGAVLCFGVALAGAAQAAPLDTVRERGTLTIGVYRDFPPFSSVEKGQVVGVDVDIGREIAHRMTLTPSILEITADEDVDDDLRNGVWRGPVTGGVVADVMMHIPYDLNLGARNDMAVLFSPYYQETLAVARARPTLSVVELSEERVGVELDSLSDLYLSGAFGGSMRDSTHRYLTYADAARAIGSGDVTALMGPRSQIEDALRHLTPEQRQKMVLSIPGTPGLSMQSWPLGMAVKVDSRDLAYAVGDVVAAMVADGTMTAIFQKHGLTYQKVNE